MSRFTTRDPDFEAKIRESVTRQGFAAHLGYELTRIEPGMTEFTCPLRPELMQQHGFAHGGLVSTLADAAAAYAAFSLMPPNSAPLTVEMKINLMAPGQGDALVARGYVLKPGRTLTVCEAKVYATCPQGESLIATALVTMMCMEGRQD